MAYAEVAGLPAVAGLWACDRCSGRVRRPRLVAASCRSGPESTTALMTAAALGSVARPSRPRTPTSPRRWRSWSALLCLLGWLGRLASLAELLSRPVLVGYMAGIAVIMIVSQLGKLTGIPVEADGFVAELAYVVAAPRRSARAHRCRWAW